MSAAAKFDPGAQRRRAMLGKVHLAKKELGLDDTTYRDVLERVTGCASAADCSEPQLGRLLDEFKAKGWKPAKGGYSGPAKSRSRPADHAAAGKARAMWISLHQLGVVRDASESALEAFARRQLHVDKLQWADQARMYRLIEALKAIAQREGWDQDLTGVPAALHVRTLKRRLLATILAKAGVTLPARVSGRATKDVVIDDQISWAAAALHQKMAPI